MHTALAMADAWRQRSRTLSATYTAMLGAPALFKPEYVKEVRAALIASEKNFEFWYAAPLD